MVEELVGILRNYFIWVSEPAKSPKPKSTHSCLLSLRKNTRVHCLTHTIACDVFLRKINVFKRALKNQGFCAKSKPERIRNRSLLAINEDFEFAKIQSLCKMTVLQSPL